jgi:hypothetical protein
MNEFEDLKRKKEKKDKKKGFITWFKEKLGFSPRGMGNVSEGARGINLAGLKGSAANIGAGRFGSAGIFSKLFGAGGIFSFIGGKAGLITLGLIALAVGTTLYMRNSGSMGDANIDGSMGSNSNIASYVPKIMRERQSASSLDLFKAAVNEGGLKDEDSVSSDEEIGEGADDKSSKDVNSSNDTSNALKGALGFENKSRLQTNMNFGLTSEIAGGDNKFSALGGFGNQMGKFGTPAKANFSNGDLLKSANSKGANAGKLSSMKAQKRPVISQGPKFNSTAGGKRAFSQAKAVKSGLTQPNYGSADSARSNMDKAWEGTTSGGGDIGLPQGGSGISSGGGNGIVQTPSTLDNIGDVTPATLTDENIPTNISSSFNTPWAGMLQQAMMFLMISALLAGIASMVSKIPVVGKILATILAVVAIGLAVMAIMIGMKIMNQFGQNKLGMIYVIGGGLAIAGAIAAIGGVWFGWSMLFSQILAGAAGIMALFASMAAGPAATDYAKKQMEQQTQQTESSNSSSDKTATVADTVTN